MIDDPVEFPSTKLLGIRHDHSFIIINKSSNEVRKLGLRHWLRSTYIVMEGRI